MRKFVGSNACCSCDCFYFGRNMFTEFRQADTTMIFTETSSWYYDTYTYKNWYTAADPNTWVSNEYLGYTRIPASGDNTDYDSNYNTVDGYETHVTNDGVGAYEDTGNEVRHLNGGFEDNGAFHYDSDADLYYRIYQDSADHVYYTLTVRSAVRVNVSDIWWWKFDQSADEPRPRTAVERHVWQTLLAPRTVEDYGFTGRNYVVPNPPTNGSAPYSVMNSIIDSASALPTNKAQWDTMNAATTVDGNCSITTQPQDANTWWEPGGTGTTNNTVTFLFDKSTSGNTVSSLFGDIHFELSWLDEQYNDPDITDIDDVTPLYSQNRVLKDIFNLPANLKDITLDGAYPLGTVVELAPTNNDTLAYADSTTSPQLRNDLVIEILDASDDTVFKTVTIGTHDGTVENGWGRYVDVDGETAYQEYSRATITSTEDLGSSIYIRVSNGVIGVSFEDPDVHSAQTTFFPKSYDLPYVDHTSGRWAEWVDTVSTFPAAFKLRYKPETTGMIGLHHIEANGVNKPNCPEIGCQATAYKTSLFGKVSSISGKWLNATNSYSANNSQTYNTRNAEIFTAINYDPCILSQITNSDGTPYPLYPAGPPQTRFEVTASGSPNNATLSVSMRGGRTGSSFPFLYPVIEYQKTGVDLTVAGSKTFSFTYAADFVSETDNTFTEFPSGYQYPYMEVDFTLTIEDTAPWQA